MTTVRTFISNYSPIFTLSGAIFGLYIMAACIGAGINPVV